MDYTRYLVDDFVADESFYAYYHKTDPNAVAFWNNWIANHPEKLDEILHAERILAKLSLHLEESEFQEAFTKFDNFLVKECEPAELSGWAQTKPVRFRQWATAAAVVVGVAFVGYHFYRPNANAIAFLTQHNGNAKISQIFLSDGTKVTLSSNSTLNYPKVFNAETREVTLDGEAFFEVQKDPSKPFIVSSRGIKTTVLGTKFNVSAYSNLSHIDVALVEGRVEVKSQTSKSKLLLQPKEMATFDVQHHRLSKSAFNTSEIAGWKDGLLVFDNASFQDIATKLKNIYGIHLIDHTRGTKWNYSGQFEKTDYLSIIKSICFAKKLNYTQTNQTFTLTN